MYFLTDIMGFGTILNILTNRFMGMYCEHGYFVGTTVYGNHGRLSQITNILGVSDSVAYWGIPTCTVYPSNGNLYSLGK